MYTLWIYFYQFVTTRYTTDFYIIKHYCHQLLVGNVAVKGSLNTGKKIVTTAQGKNIFEFSSLFEMLIFGSFACNYVYDINIIANV